MNSKISILAFAILSVLVLSSLVSALSFSSSVELTRPSPSQVITITNDGASNYTSVELTRSSTDFSVSPSSISTLNVGSSASINVSTLSSLIDSLSIGSHSYSLSALGIINSTSNESATLSASIIKGFCDNGAVGGNLTITDFSISNDGNGDKDTWYRLDKMTIDVDVKNTGADTDDDVIVELGLYDADGNNVIGDLDFSNKDEEQVNIGSLDKSDKETATFEFVVPADLSSGSGYQLVVKAYVDSAQDESCVDSGSDLSDKYFQKVEVKKESDDGRLIGFDNIKLAQDTLTCGDQDTLAFDIYNLGSKTQDQTRITLTSNSLGISQSAIIKKDLEEGDKATVEFSFAIPSNTKDGTYALSLNAEYGYDDHDDSYEDSLDDQTVLAIKVIGCQATVVPVTNQTTTTTETDEESTGSFWSNALQGNGLIWTVAIINILLVIVIILVAVRIARR